MTKFEINVEIGTKPNGKPDRRRLVVHAKNEQEAEELGATKAKAYGPQAQIVSVYKI